MPTRKSPPETKSKPRKGAFGFVQGHPWLSLSAGLMALLMTGLTILTPWRVSQDILITWNLCTALYLLVIGYEMARTDEAGMRKRAQAQDVGKWAILVLTLIATAVCIVAIVAELTSAKSLNGMEKSITLSLVGATIVTTWLFVHTTFALHYAHAYYISCAKNKEPCLTFPDNDPTPDYDDFLYFAFIIGTSAQTADVSITSKPLRRLALGHCIFAFFFNTSILAVSINIAASLVT